MIEDLITHYKNISSTESLDYSEWVKLFEGVEEEDLINPFSPGQSDFYKLDEEWLPLADCDELMIKSGKVLHATCVAYWFSKYPFDFFSHYRPLDFWKDVARRVYIKADFEKVGLTSEDWLDLLREKGWFSSESLSALIVNREIFWRGRSPTLKDRVLSVWENYKNHQEEKRKVKLMDDALGNMGGFEPSNRLKSLKDLDSLEK